MFSNKKNWLIVIIILTLFNIFLVLFFQPITDLGKKILRGEPSYYAVYLNNGEIYFGQIKKITSEIIILKDVFFLETLTANNQASSSGEEIQVLPQKTYQLVRRGSDNFASTDNVLFINRSAVIFWEKLNPDSELVKWIKKAKK